MLGQLNHVAIAVPNIAEAAEMYKVKFGAKVSGQVPQPDHGVTTVFVDLGNTKLELLEPLGEDSPIAGFLAKNPKGGIHHICVEVDDIDAACEQVTDHGVTITGTGNGATQLTRYERWRRFDTLEMGLMTDVLNRLFSNDNPALRLVRDVGLGLVDRAPALKRVFAAEARGDTASAPRLLRGEPI